MTSDTLTARQPPRRADFPADFAFGTATAAFQVEGAVTEDGRGVSIWDTFSHTPGRIADASNADVTCDHYHRWESDLDLMQGLGVNAYRFSVAWPRVQPFGSGAVNPAGLDFYERLVDGMLARGIRPYLTLYHWDLPQPLQDAGGWANRDTADRFAEYASVVAGRLGSRVASYATLNEPWCSSILSYQIGEHAPGLQDRRAALSAAHHLLLGHGQAMSALRGLNLTSQLGTVLNFTAVSPATQAPEDVAAARILDGTFNRWFIEPLLTGAYPRDVWGHYGPDVPEVHPGDLELISQPLDYLGVNYYTRNVVTAAGEQPTPGAEYTEMGWEVYPQGLTNLLTRFKRDYPLPPVYVTENGSAFVDIVEGGQIHDPRRTAYLQSHLNAVHAAMQAGVDVRGYFLWSFMDNFEWAHGYTKRFGLLYTDYKTQARTWKDSGLWFQSFLNQPVLP
ncbi:GH1 family beta-glucosidase [Deinococcus altitudinis]|uniref:GH1 family beta-glucosidase n=1 Tax=Deinococcus altitudinis TaxID=468914 RepID=UPI003891D472